MSMISTNLSYTTFVIEKVSETLFLLMFLSRFSSLFILYSNSYAIIRKYLDKCSHQASDMYRFLSSVNTKADKLSNCCHWLSNVTCSFQSCESFLFLKWKSTQFDSLRHLCTSPFTKSPSYSTPSLQRNFPTPCIIPLIKTPSYLQPLSEWAHPGLMWYRLMMSIDKQTNINDVEYATVGAMSN